MSKKLALQDVKNSFVAEAGPPSASTVDELHQEISVCYTALIQYKIQCSLGYVICILFYNPLKSSLYYELFLDCSRGNKRKGNIIRKYSNENERIRSKSKKS